MLFDIQAVTKRFGKTLAVNQVTCTLPEGEISGFLGPNGAGKTTLIRMIMDIFRPDEGRIQAGSNLSGHRKDHIGYLPEERGLYTKTKVRETLIYFGELKGLSAKRAADHADYFLDKLEMKVYAKMAIGKLSKGNQQKIQLISALIAKPRLLILDEPFSGLDPLNTQLVSDLILQLRDEGTSIVLSTHQMNQAESFCQNIYLFNRGELILSGPLNPIIDRHSGGQVLVETDQALPENQRFAVHLREGTISRIRLNEDVSLQNLMAWLAEQPFKTMSLRPYRMPLSEIFIKEVRAHA